MEQRNYEKLVDICRKLQALAERGVGGEAINAASLLKRIMTEHNITLDDDNACDKPTWHEYDIMTVHQDLFFAIVWNTMSNWDGSYRSVKGKRRIIRICCTELEHLEITAKFDWYARDYDKQRRLFMQAYISKNELFSISQNPDRHVAKSKLSNEDLAILYGLSCGIKKSTHLKQLEAK